MTSSSRLVAFYAGSGTDHRGRTRADIHAFSHDELEAEHDFIQWLFPLMTPSPVNSAAPTLDQATIRAFLERPELREALRASFEMMLGFYGFEIPVEHDSAIVRGANWLTTAHNWLTPGNHNFRRITRILRSMALLGHTSLSQEFLTSIEDVCAEHGAVIGSDSMSHWRRAVGGEP